MINIIQNRKIYFGISGLLVVLSIASLLIWGLVPAIDFTGGTLMEVEFSASRPTNQKARESLADLGLGEVKIQPTGARGLILRLKDINEKNHEEIISRLKFLDEELNQQTLKSQEQTKDSQQLGEAAQAEENLQLFLKENIGAEERAKEILDKNQEPEELNESIAGGQAIFAEIKFESIGPVIGRELRQKTTYAIVVVAVSIILYIAWAFRKVSKPVQSWKYGLGAVIALCHDLLIVTGIFSILGRFLGYEIDILFVTALLTILGYSVNDTIVVYDRTRENLFRYQGFDFEQVVNKSVNETIVRSLNTSLTTLIVLFAIFLFGGASIRNFVLALICGIVVGTYSSIFIASPLLVVWEKLRRR